MIGKLMLKQFMDALDVDDLSDEYASRRKLFEALDRAACLFARETGVLHATTDITTAADTQAYDLPPDFVRLYMRDRRGRLYLRHTNGDGADFYPYQSDYASIYRENNTDSSDHPCRFAVIDKPDRDTAVIGTATADGDKADDGSCVLTDSTKAFTSTDRVHARDVIINQDDDSVGYVLEVTDATHLVVALFGGSADAFTEDDEYFIQPASEYQLFLDAPYATAGHTLSIPYVCLPAPVYHDTGWWRFNARHCRGIIDGAATLFKTPKKEYAEAAAMGGLFQQEVMRCREELASAILSAGRRR